MKETTWIVDPHSGLLTVEGLSQADLKTLAPDLLTEGKQGNLVGLLLISETKFSSPNGKPD